MMEKFFRPVSPSDLAWSASGLSCKFHFMIRENLFLESQWFPSSARAMEAYKYGLVRWRVV